MIGNRGYAMYIHEWARAEQGGSHYETLPYYAPAGWKYLGSGCYRAAYLSPDGVVYKVQRWSDSTYQSNMDEYRNWWRLRLNHRMPEGSRLPLMGNHEIGGGEAVNALEYVATLMNRYEGGDYAEKRKIVGALERRLQLWDMHMANVAVDRNGIVVPIDLG